MVSVDANKGNKVMRINQQGIRSRAIIEGLVVAIGGAALGLYLWKVYSVACALDPNAIIVHPNNQYLIPGKATPRPGQEIGWVSVETLGSIALYAFIAWTLIQIHKISEWAPLQPMLEASDWGKWWRAAVYIAISLALIVSAFWVFSWITHCGG